MSKPRKKQTSAAPEANAAAPPPPAYFLSVTVENVRCFGPAQTLDLSNENGRPAKWTVILGDNGTGKTTLLQAIASLEAIPQSQGSDDGEDRFVTPRYWGDDLKLLRKPYRVHLRISSRLSLGYALDKQEGIEVIEDWSVDDPRHDDSFFSVPNVSWANPEEVGSLICYAYGASRHMAKTRLAKDEVGDPTASLFSDDAAIPNVEEWLLQADYAAKRASKSDKKRAEWRRDQVIEMLRQLLPDVKAIRYAEPEEPRLVPRVEFQTPYGWVQIDQLGLGYRTMIAWTVDVARRLFERYPDSPNPLAEPAVVLVDEIDLHLHPQWQRKIIDFLSERFLNTQFIVTAHSYWLAYEWSNLFFACEICNRRQKGNLFPLSDPSKRAISHHDDYRREEPFFIHPAQEDPEQYISFQRHEAVALHLRGRTTIDVLGLNRPELLEAQLDQYEDLKWLNTIIQLQEKLPPDVVNDAQTGLNKAISNQAQYSAMARAALNAGFSA